MLAADGGAGAKIAACPVELHAAVGQIDHHGGEGGASGVLRAGEPDGDTDTERAAERGVSAEGVGLCAEAGYPAKGGRRQRDLAAVPESGANCGTARTGSHSAGILGGVVDDPR
jgi:hypothetical protein